MGETWEKERELLSAAWSVSEMDAPEGVADSIQNSAVR